MIGRSGCGKGTQAKLLMDYIREHDEERGLLYVQTGLEFREFIEGQTFSQQLAKTIAGRGGLVPEFLAVLFWAQKITNEYKHNDHMLIDGTPRKPHEALVLDSVFDFYGIPKPHIIHINVSEQWSKDRMMGRMRADDTKENIDNRLGWYGKAVIPTIEYYKNNPQYFVHDIDGERPISDVHKDIVEKIQF